MERLGRRARDLLGRPRPRGLLSATRSSASRRPSERRAASVGPERTDELRGVRQAPVLTVIEDLAAAARRHRRRLPAPAPAQPPARQAARRSTWTASSARCRTSPGRALGPVDPANLTHGPAARRAPSGAPLQVFSLDKFPRMTDYVAPTRRARRRRRPRPPRRAPGRGHDGDARGLRELQRRHARALDGRGPDLARASSSATAQTSAAAARSWARCRGGGSEVISIGERCLLGANAGIGISLGDDCTVEAGLYVTAGTLITLPDGEVVKGRELSGANGLLFRRNSRTGTVEALPRSGKLGRAQRGAARERLTSRRAARGDGPAVRGDRGVQPALERREPRRLERLVDAVGRDQRDPLVGAVGRAPTGTSDCSTRGSDSSRGRGGADVLELRRDARDSTSANAERSGSSTSWWFQKRATVPPGAQHARRSCASRARGRSSASASPQVIRSNVRPRSSQSSNARDLDRRRRAARDRGHPRVELDAEHRQPASHQRARDLAGPAADVEHPLAAAARRARRAARPARVGPVAVVELGDRAEGLGPPAIAVQLRQGRG